jgi:hypothetical protein
MPPSWPLEGERMREGERVREEDERLHKGQHSLSLSLSPLQAGQQSCLVVKTTQQKFVGF